jgi:hypothetical protein
MKMNDKIKDGGPAFPINNNDVITIVTNNGNHPEGMSLRDYFAAKAMQGIISAHNENGEWTGVGDIEMNKIMAETAYSVADAMLEARGK